MRRIGEAEDARLLDIVQRLRLREVAERLHFVRQRLNLVGRSVAVRGEDADLLDARFRLANLYVDPAAAMGERVLEPFVGHLEGVVPVAGDGVAGCHEAEREHAHRDRGDRDGERGERCAAGILADRRGGRRRDGGPAHAGFDEPRFQGRFEVVAPGFGHAGGGNARGDAQLVAQPFRFIGEEAEDEIEVEPVVEQRFCFGEHRGAAIELAFEDIRINRAAT